MGGRVAVGVFFNNACKMFSNQETTLRLIEAKFNKQEMEFIVSLLHNKGEGGYDENKCGTV